MTTKSCPVCRLLQDKETPECSNCGWDFSPMLGTPEQAEELLQERLLRARADWQQSRYDPERVPQLERDPFETPEEFASRLAERAWYVGEGELCKQQYEVANGRFPIRFVSVHDWAKLASKQHEQMYLRQSRDDARKLYTNSSVWPIYVQLRVRDGKVMLESLQLLTSGKTLSVFSEGLPEQPQLIRLLDRIKESLVSAMSSLDQSQRQRCLAYSLLGLGLIAILLLLLSASSDQEDLLLAQSEPAPGHLSPLPMPTVEGNALKSISGKEPAQEEELIAGRYKDLGDGTVLDVQTGLQWMRCALGQTWTKSNCDGNAKEFKWGDAPQAAKALNVKGYAGHKDWRVPTIEELKGLRYCKTGGQGIWIETDQGCEGDYVRPTIESNAFPASRSSWFWSSSPYANNSVSAWGVHFGNGYVGSNGKYHQRYVRLVRGGQ